MKKILLPTLLLLFICNALQAQTSPTKEETITWLKQKMDNYLIKGNIFYGTYSNIKLESISECEIVITYIESQIHSGVNHIKHHRIIAPTASITQVYPYFKYTLNVVKSIIEKYSSNINGIAGTEKNYNGGSSFNDFIALGIDNREDKIHERVLKAFAHLSSFCPKNKEAF